MRLILMAALFASAATGALAQSAPSQTGSIEELVVTGEKANRSVQNTPTSAAIITARTLEQEKTLTIQDVYDRTVNVSETLGASGYTIRGIANTGVSGAGNADTATVYVDGAPIPSQALYGGPTDLWDIGQVEVLRGPQSTIQGLNSMAGSVVITTADPTMDWRGAARLLWSDRDDRTYSAAVSGPIVRDQLAFRVSADRIDDDGFVKNLVRGGTEDRVQATNLRAKLRWTPTAMPDLTAQLSYDWARRRGGYQYVFTDASKPDYLQNPTSSANRPDSGEVDSDIATLNLSYRLSDKLKLASITSWNQVSVNNFSDIDAGPTDAAYLNNRYAFHTVTEELRANYTGERLDGLLGVWFYHRDEAFGSAQHVNVPTPVDTITALLQGGGFPAATAASIANTYAKALPAVPVDYTGNSPNAVTTGAIFGDARYPLTGRLFLIGGFRYDHEDNRFVSDQTATFVGSLPNPLVYGPRGTPLNLAINAVNGGVLGLVAAANASGPPSERSFDALLPKAGLSFDWTPAITTAVTVQRGYRSGGSSQNVATSTLVPYDPEFSWNYEGSLRSSWLDGALSVNANLFYMDWTDQQVNVTFSSNMYDSNTVNVGKSHLWGFEIETRHRLSRAVDWYASVGHVDAKFDSFSITTGGVTTELGGAHFSYAPDWTATAGANLRLADGFVANVNANWRDGVYTTVDADQAKSRVEGRTVVNTRLGYDTKVWGLFLNVHNLFDDRYRQYVDPVRNVVVVGQPRTIGAELELHW